MTASHDFATPLEGPTFPARPNGAWVPIRTLAQRHRPDVLAHLLMLAQGDRYLRFGYLASDEQIVKYVDQIDFDRDEVFGIFNRRLELIAMAHLAYAPPASDTPGEPLAEFGVSVLPASRHRGFGARLFEHAMLHARNRGIERLMIHALSENVPMLKIARSAGATVVRQGSEADAWLRLPPDTFSSHVGELVERQVAEIDYGLKAQAKRVNELIAAFAPGEVPPPGDPR